MKLIKLFEQYIREEAEIASGPVTPGLNYKNLADSLDKSMRGLGTDKPLLISVLNQIKTPQDLKNLNNAFGTREDQTLDQWFRGDIIDGTDWKNIIQAFYDRINQTGIGQGGAAGAPVRESLFAKWEIADEIEHNGYIINVYKKGDSEVLGHPRPADEPETNNKELLIYDMSKLDKLKHSIDIMTKDNFKKGSTHIPFPEDRGTIKNPNFKGHIVDVGEAVTMPAAPVIPVVAASSTPARDEVVEDCLANIYTAMYSAMDTFVAEAKKAKFTNGVTPTEEEMYLAKKKFLDNQIKGSF